MIKQFTVIVLSTFLLSILSACGNEVSSLADTVDPIQQTQYIETDQEDKAINKPVQKMISTSFSGLDKNQDVENTLNGEKKVAVDNKILVVYFSCTGTTELLAVCCRSL